MLPKSGKPNDDVAIAQTAALEPVDAMRTTVDGQGDPADARGSIDDPPTQIANRYELGDVLGAGGFGSVFQATDRLTGDQVAVKILHERGRDELVRFRSEVSLLRLLRLPNLVRLLDDGIHEGRAFLVTELVDGSPFPGVPSPATWDEIERPTVALLESLARVHAQGVVHRDLKPENVLVLEDGRPVILDFGVSFGPGFSTDGEGFAMGTPAFLSPEQAMGRLGDATTDLYAVGVMLFEALTGRLPHEQVGVGSLLRAKVNHAAPPVLEVAPDVPAHVATCIDTMLRTDSNARPESATVVLQQLGVRRAALSMPWLGPTTQIEEALAALRAGRTVSVQGAPGYGHSRFMREVAARWEAAHGAVWATRSSRHVWGSLPAEVRRRIGRAAREDWTRVDDALREAASEGVLFVIDDAPRVDPATRAAMERTGVTAIWAGRLGLDVEIALSPLSETSLRALFHGPDVILHLREDAARLVHQRTSGVPRAVEQLVDAWEQAGLCYRDGERWRIDRQAIARLETGLRLWSPTTEPEPPVATEAQDRRWSSVAAAPAGRLLHLVRTRDELGLVREALAVRDDAVASGRLDPAFAALRDALGFARLTPRIDDEWALARALALTALEAQSSRTLDLALYEIELSRRVGERIERLVELLDVTRIVRYKERDTHRALPLARALATWGDDASLEKWRRAASMVAGFGLEPEAHLALANAHLAWAASCGSAGIAASVRGWVGVALYRVSRFEEAARMHERAARGAEGPAAEALAWGNAASAWMECGAMEAAIEAAQTGFALADGIRLMGLASRCLSVWRSSRARAGQDVPPLPELAALAQQLDANMVWLHLFDMEASVAWHMGDIARCVSYARLAEAQTSAAGQHGVASNLRALLAMTEGRVDPRVVEDLRTDRFAATPRIAAHSAAFTLMVDPSCAIAEERLKQALSLVPETMRGATRWEFLSYNQCVALIGQRGTTLPM